jgi:ferredoxin-2, mitochondrial
MLRLLQRLRLPVSMTQQLFAPSSVGNSLLQQPLAVRWHGGSAASKDAPTIQVSFRLADESIKTVDARIGESLLETAHRHDVDLEGACEGVCACSTCHLILPQDIYDALPEPSEDEEDMLDMAFGLTETSRLGCQIQVTEAMEGAVLELPKATRNFYVDGHVPKPH